jgi:CP family cyanate transporter-like MFS transporter
VSSPAPSTSAATQEGVRPRHALLVGVAIVLTALNLRTAVTSVGPVLQELQAGLGLSSGQAGLVTTMPVICFALIGFAGPPLSARFRDGHVLAGALFAMAVGLVVRALAGSFWLFLLGTAVAMVRRPASRRRRLRSPRSPAPARGRGTARCRRPSPSW